MITETVAVRGSWRRRRVSSNPSMFGIITSASTRSGQRSLAASRAKRAVGGHAHVVARGAKLDLEQPGDERVVVDDEQALSAADAVRPRVGGVVLPAVALGHALILLPHAPPRVLPLESAL